MNKLESLIDAIGKLNGIHNPESECYQIRNPLMLQSFAKPGKHEITEDGLRVFHSMLSGYKAAVFDITLKISGNSRAGVGPEDTLESLLGVYRIKTTVAMENVISFLRRALHDQNIGTKTQLSYFQDEKCPTPHSQQLTS